MGSNVAIRPGTRSGLPTPASPWSPKKLECRNRAGHRFFAFPGEVLRGATAAGKLQNYEFPPALGGGRARLHPSRAKWRQIRRRDPDSGLASGSGQRIDDRTGTVADGVDGGKAVLLSDGIDAFLRFFFAERGSVDGDSGEPRIRIGQPRCFEASIHAVADGGQRIVRKPAHMSAGRLVAKDQRIGLGAVDQSGGDPGIGGVEERALALDQVPVPGIRLG